MQSSAQSWRQSCRQFSGQFPAEYAGQYPREYPGQYDRRLKCPSWRFVRGSAQPLDRTSLVPGSPCHCTESTGTGSQAALPDTGFVATGLKEGPRNDRGDNPGYNPVSGPPSDPPTDPPLDRRCNLPADRDFHSLPDSVRKVVGDMVPDPDKNSIPNPGPDPDRDPKPDPGQNLGLNRGEDPRADPGTEQTGVEDEAAGEHVPCEHPHIVRATAYAKTSREERARQGCPSERNVLASCCISLLPS